MVDFAALAVTVPLLALALAAATRGHRTPAAAGVSVLGAALAVLVGAIGGGPAADQIYDVGSVLILLSTLTILAHLADVEGVSPGQQCFSRPAATRHRWRCSVVSSWSPR